MKVLEKGKQKKWDGEYRCTGGGNGNRGCESLLLVEEDDVFRTESSALGDTMVYLTFRCPECGSMTDIASQVHLNAVPRQVWDQAPKGVTHPRGGICHPNDRPASRRPC